MIAVRKATRKDTGTFLSLLRALAKFEHLDPPSKAGERRLVEDIFKKKRIFLLLGFVGNEPASYALYFFTYSSFLARPTLYLEDLFVSPKFRGQKVGTCMFKELVKIAKKERCGRIEWSVLTWNKNAIKFYEKLGAKRLKEWYFYRLDSSHIESFAKD